MCPRSWSLLHRVFIMAHISKLSNTRKLGGDNRANVNEKWANTPQMVRSMDDLCTWYWPMLLILISYNLLVNN